MSAIEDLHARVDRRAASLELRHAARLNCGRGCSACCVDEITVFRVEADSIRENAGDVLNEAPAPVGRCAFLDEEGACRIYTWRPYVCRTQGLPLRWLEEDGDDLIEYRDICTLNMEGEAIETLSEEDCWSIGDVESALATLEVDTHGEPKRVSLRSLFAS